MASSHSTVHPLAFAAHEVIKSATLRRIFGTSLPSHLQVNEDGSVHANSVADYLLEQGELGLKIFHAESEVVIPGTHEALLEF